PELPEGVIFAPKFAPLAVQKTLWAAVREIATTAPFAHARVKGGGQTSAAMTNCGAWGWWSDIKGYRYQQTQPSGAPWPAMPEIFLEWVARAVAESPWP